MLPHEVLDRALRGGYRKPVAAHLGFRSTTSIDKWCALPKCMGGEGESNPVQRTIELVCAARIAGAPEADSIVVYINTELGYAPPIRVSPRELASVLDVASATREFGDVLAGVAPAFDADGLTHGEAAHLLEQLDQHLAVMVAMRAGVARFVFECEAAALARRGPHRAPFIELRKAATA